MSMIKKISAVGFTVFMIGLAFVVVYQIQHGNFQYADATSQSNVVTASCSVSATSASTGSYIIYSANATGGSAVYTYSWSGSENLTGTGNSVVKAYTTAGTKTATVQVTSGNSSATAQCTVVIKAPTNNPGTTTPSCVSNPEADLSGSISTSHTSAHVTNNSTLCSYKVGFASYKVFTSNIEDQVLFDSDVRTIAPKTTITLNIDVPSCKYQSDLFYGDLISSFKNGARYGTRLIGAETVGSTYCSNGTPTTTPTTGKLRIVKTVINDNGGTKHVSDFALYIENTRVTSGQILTLPANTYSVHENNLPGYTAGSWGGDCTSNGQVTLHAGDDKTCTITNNDVAPSTNHTSLDGTCTASDTILDIGQTVTYTVTATGGSGTYIFTWTGDNVYGRTTSRSTSYNSAGVKRVQVHITSRNEIVSRTCTVTVVAATTPTYPSFDGSCSVNPSFGIIGDTITYTAHATGGNGYYSYSWSGTNGLSGVGQTVQKSYGSKGTKIATVAITSDGQTIYRNCQSTIGQPSGGGGTSNVYASCYANVTSAYTGDTVTWNVSASGGNGYYTYSWSGTDNLYGYGSSIQKAYYSVGSKYATVVVTSNGYSTTQTCSLYVSARTYYPPTYYPPTYYPPTTGTVYLSQVPYTGIGDNLKVFGFILALLAWSGLVSFIIVKRKASKAGLSVGQLINGTSYAGIPSTTRQLSQLTSKAHKAIPIVANITHDIKTTPVEQTVIARKHQSTSIQEQVFVSAPEVTQTGASYEEVYARVNGNRVASVQYQAQPTDIIEALELEARSMNTLVSADGLELIAEASGNDHSLAKKTLNYLVKLYHGAQPSESRWGVLNTEMIKQIVSQDMVRA